MVRRVLSLFALLAALSSQGAFAHPYELLIHLSSGTRTICANSSCGISSFNVSGPCGGNSWIAHVDEDPDPASIPRLFPKTWYKVYVRGSSGSPESNLLKIKFPSSISSGSVDTYLTYSTGGRYLSTCSAGTDVIVRSIGYSVGLSGPSSLCKGASALYTASPVVADPNLTFEWFRSYDGVSFSSYGNGDNPQSYTMRTQDFWVKVRVTFGYGQTAEKVKFVDYGGIPGQGCPAF